MIHNQRYFACSVGHCFDGIWGGYLFWQHSAFTLVVIITAGELDSRSRYYRTLRGVEEEVPLPQFKCFIFSFSTWIFRDCYEAGVPVASQASSHQQVSADSYIGITSAAAKPTLSLFASTLSLSSLPKVVTCC